MIDLKKHRYNLSWDEETKGYNDEESAQGCSRGKWHGQSFYCYMAKFLAMVLETFKSSLC